MIIFFSFSDSEIAFHFPLLNNFCGHSYLSLYRNKVAFKIFFIADFQQFHYDMLWCDLMFLLWSSLKFLDLWFYSFYQILINFNHCFFIYFFLLHPPFWDSDISDYLKFSYGLLKLYLFCVVSFFLSTSFSVNIIFKSSSLLIFSSEIFNLL